MKQIQGNRRLFQVILSFRQIEGLRNRDSTELERKFFRIHEFMMICWKSHFSSAYVSLHSEEENKRMFAMLAENLKSKSTRRKKKTALHPVHQEKRL